MKKFIFIIFFVFIFFLSLFWIDRFFYVKAAGPISVPPASLITSIDGHVQIGVSQHYGGAVVYYKDDRISDSTVAQGNIIDYSGSGTLFSTLIRTLPWSRTEMERCYSNQRSYDPDYGFDICPNAQPFNSPTQDGYSGDSWAGNPNPTSVNVSNNQIYISYRGINYNFGYNPVPSMTDANRNEWQTDFWGDVRIYFHPTLTDVAVVETKITYCKDMNDYCRNQWIVTQDNRLSTLFAAGDRNPNPDFRGPYGRVAYRSTSGNFKIIDSGQSTGACADNAENWVAMLQLSSDRGIGISVPNYESVRWFNIVADPTKRDMPVGSVCGDTLSAVPSIFANQPKIENFETQNINRVESIMVAGTGYNDFPRYQFQPGGWYKFTTYVATGNLDEIRSKIMIAEGVAGYPVISNIQVTNVTHNSATITWDTNEPTTSQIKYGTTNSYGQETVEDTNSNTTHSVTLTNLQSSTTYHFQAVSKDGDNNQTFSGDFTFTTNAPPTLGVSFSLNPAGGISPLSGVVMRADVGGSVTGTINYTFYCNRADAGIDIATGYAHKADATNVNPYSAPAGICDSIYSNTGTYTAKVIVERGGLITEARVVISVTTPPPPPPPPIPPTISSIQVTNITYNSVTITWTTDKPATSQIKYGTTAAYGQQSLENTNLTTSHSIALTSLQSSTTYHFQAISEDNIGTQGVSGDFSFTTSATPVLSVNLSANPSSGTAPLNGVDLTADVGGNVSGTINYTFYCNRSDAGINVTTGYTAKYDNVNQTSQIAVNACNYSSAGTYTAKVIVERATLQAEDRITINVSSPPPPPPPPPPPLPAPSVNLSSSRFSIDVGENITLSWSTNNATSCTASDDWSGSKSLSGTELISPAESSIYNLTCTGPGGTGSDSISITVVPTPLPPSNPPPLEPGPESEPEPEPAPAAGEESGFIVFKNPLTSDNLKDVIDSLGGILRTIAVGIGVILIIIAGIIIMTSGGNTEKLDRGKKMLKWTLIGFAIVTVASFIIDLLQELLAPVL
jgi:hypothetical protein